MNRIISFVMAVVLALTMAMAIPALPVTAEDPPVEITSVDWFEDWDSYATGQDMHGVGGWKGWYNNPAATAYTSSDQYLSSPNSIAISGASDLVHEFSGYDDGMWRFTAWQFVPSGYTGSSYFILLNNYADSGTDNHWSTQVSFDGAANLVTETLYGNLETLPLVRDQWVEISVVIDLEANWQRFYYGGTLLYQNVWAWGGGITSIGALNLFGNGASTVYYDNLSLVEMDISDWFEKWDSYATGQDMHGVGGWKGWYNNPAATAYTSSVRSFSAPNSIAITGTSDLVHEFFGYDDAVWRFTAWQFVPAGYAGETYFILLNSYADWGTNNWSTQVTFDGGSDLVSDTMYGGNTLPLIRDQWVEIRVEIDLEANWQRFYYGGALLYQDVWASGTGITSIGAVDLFGNGASTVYYDNLSLVEMEISDWFENWDSYATGQDMHGANGWKGWYNNPAATAYTSSVRSFSAPNSIAIAGTSDLVHEFFGYDDGVWRFTAWQFVPAGYAGQSYFILLNQYADGGPNNWSAQVYFDGGSSEVIDTMYSGGTLPLIRDQWVEIRVEIDLEANWQRFYYGGALLYEDVWASGTGITSIGAVDLFGNGASPVYYDNLSLVKIEVVDWFEDWDSYFTGRNMHGVNGWKGWDNNSGATAYTSSDQSISVPNSIAIAGTSDLVHEFFGYDDGAWCFTAWQFLPAAYTGSSYFILLNNYSDGGPKDWSTQVYFDGGSNQVSDSLFGASTLPLVRDQWVEIRVLINLETNWQKFYYGGDLLYENVWASGTGITSIGALDLFANGASPVYYDDLSLVMTINYPPAAVDDAYSVAENGILVVPAPGVLGNDTDPDSGALTALLVDTVGNGSLDFHDDGSFTYTPDADWWGIDSFTYKASDGDLDSNVATVTISVIPLSVVTSSSLCTFDFNAGADGDQFRLIFTPIVTAPGTFKLSASNPGQFSYNIYNTEGGNVQVTIPYPFVTQGTVPIQFYDGVEMASCGEGLYCFSPGMLVGSSNETIVLGDYVGEEITIDIAMPEGADFITIHLDYGLKGTAPYTAGGSDFMDAKGDKGPLTDDVVNLTDYVFSVDFNSTSDTALVQNENVFKKIVGVGGMVTDGTGGVPGKTVQLINAAGVVVGEAETDSDGWYLINYKHTGKAASYTVKLTDPEQTQSVTLKANGLATVDFTIP